VRWRKSRTKRKDQGSLKLPNGHSVTFETVAGRTTAVVKSEQRRGQKGNDDVGVESKYFKKKTKSKKDSKGRKRRRKN
jgi:hypothetical protein